MAVAFIYLEMKTIVLLKEATGMTTTTMMTMIISYIFQWLLKVLAWDKTHVFLSSFIYFFVCLLNSTKDRRGGTRPPTGFQWEQKHQINMKTWDQKAETHTTVFFLVSRMKIWKFFSFEGILTICCWRGGGPLSQLESAWWDNSEKERIQKPLQQDKEL